jgi:4Fe-4S ferredoxin
MTTRGTTIKRDTPRRLTLLRPMITRRYEFVADHDRCCGCKTCETICPHEAITVSAAELLDWRVAVRARVDVDPARCSFCGECIVMCPTHALSMTINGAPELPAVKGEAFPTLIRTMRVEQGPCLATTDVSYVDNCPAGAISADIQRDGAGRVVAVSNVAVDTSLCFNCTRCMEEGPTGAFTVTKPFRGRTCLKVALCPPGCQACADVCPTNAITYDGSQVALDERFCLYCGACEHVCPVEGALGIQRSGFLHTPIRSGAWFEALEKLVCPAALAAELDAAAQARRRGLASYLAGVPDAAGRK